MFRTLLAALIASGLVLNAWSAAAATGTGPTRAVGTVAADTNRSALPPGGAAGIKKAQGIEGDGYWREAALVIGAFVVVFVLLGINDDDETTTTTGTGP
jgi:hypothetical protein